MADELSADEQAALELEADTTKWDAGLDRARSTVDSWSGRVEERFARVAETIRSRTAGIVGAVSAIREQSAETGDIAGAFGTVIGGTIGTALGGPVGTAIGAGLGRSISQAIAENVNLAGAVDRITGEADGVATIFSDQAAEISDDWQGLRFSIENTFDQLKEIVTRTGLADLFAGDLDAIQARFEGLAAEVGSKLEDLLAQSLARIVDAINAGIERFQGPVASILDWLQDVATKIGLVDGETVRWGDSIRELKNVGETVFKAVAGVVQVLVNELVIAGSAITKYLVVPMLDFFSRVLAGFRELNQYLRDLPEELGGGEGGIWAEAARGADIASRRLALVSQRALAEAEKGLARDLGFGLDTIEERVNRLLERGRDLNRQEDFARRVRDTVLAGVGGLGGEAPAAAPVAEISTRRVSALVAGSQEALRVILADQQRAAQPRPNDPAARAAKAAEENVAEARKQVAAIEKLDRRLEQIRDILPTEVV